MRSDLPMTFDSRCRLILFVALIANMNLGLPVVAQPLPVAGQDVSDVIIFNFAKDCLDSPAADEVFTGEERESLLLVAKGDATLSAELEEKLYQELNPENTACAQASLFLLVRSGRVESLNDVPSELRGRAWGAMLMSGKAPPYSQEVSDILIEFIKSTGGDGYEYLAGIEPITSSYTYENLKDHLAAMLDRCWKWGANYPELKTASPADIPWPSTAILQAIRSHYPADLESFLKSQLTGLERLFHNAIPSRIRHTPDLSIAAGVRPAIEMLVEESGNSEEVRQLLQGEAQRLEDLANELEKETAPLLEEIAIKDAEGKYVYEPDRDKLAGEEWIAGEFREIAKTMRELTEVPESTPAPDAE